MYSYKWNKKTGGYTLIPETGKFVASEIRPVYAQELKLIGFDRHFRFDECEERPICWARQNVYTYRGEEIAKIENVRYGCAIEPDYLVGSCALKPSDIEAMVAAPENQRLMAALVADTQKHMKEMYDKYMAKCDVAYIGFSGGKDSMLLLDICHRTLPLSVPVVFSDTDMELPDTYKVWEKVQTPPVTALAPIKALRPTESLSAAWVISPRRFIRTRMRKNRRGVCLLV